MFGKQPPVACHNGSVPRWLRATCWNGHREVRATMYTYTQHGWEGLGCQWLAGLDGRGWGLGMGCQWLAGLVCRVCLCAIWMGGLGGGLGWVANG